MVEECSHGRTDSMMGSSVKWSDPSRSVPMVIKEIQEDVVERGLIDDLKNLFQLQVPT